MARKGVTPPAAPKRVEEDVVYKEDDGDVAVTPQTHEAALTDGIGTLGVQPPEGVDPNTPTPMSMSVPQAAPVAPKKGGKYYEISASDSTRLAEKDEAVRAGKRVEKVGTSMGAVYRIYE